MPLALDLQKDESIVLRGDQKMEDGFMMIGLGWDEPKKPGVTIDVDSAVFGRSAAGETNDLDNVCYFKHLDCSWAHHGGDNLTGVGQIDVTGDDERIWINLGKVPADVNHIDVVCNIYNAAAKKQSFGDLPGGQIRLVSVPSMTEHEGEEKVRISFTDDALFDAAGMLFVQIARKGATWEVKRVDLTNPAFAAMNTAVNFVSPQL